MSHAMLNQLRGHPAHGAFSGGSFANPDIQSNTVMKMFAPGADIQPPATPILDPFTNKLRTRFEVPDTSRTVSLGEIVMFTTLTNKENFMTKYIYPIVDWGWSVRTFGWSIWNFPQHPVRPTPETAPPRFLSSAKLSDSTSLMRFSIGQHMSNEYGKTTMGKANQGYNLEQMELSVQESLNLMAINELKRCQHKHRRLMENLGEYTVVDLENTMKKEVSQFCRPQKMERGFQTLWEEIAQDMARVGGKATSAILTNRINSLILAKPEMTEYYRAGPQGPATVASPNRSFLPNGITVYYTKSYPERFGLDVDPWQNITQIGGYHKSLELPILMDNDKEYLQNYSSKVRDIHIFNQETDAHHTISVATMLEQAYIWRDDGTLAGASEPPATNRSRGGTISSSDLEDNYRDFLSFNPNEVFGFQPLSIDESFCEDDQRDRYRATAASKLSSDNQFPKGLQIFGQLAPEHFGWQNIRDTGGMIMYRLASLAEIEPAVFSQRISAGLRLYKDMCKHEPDLDFVTFAIKNHLRDLYRTSFPALVNKTGPVKAPLSLKNLWVDTEVTTREALFENMASAFLERDEWLGVGKLKGIGGGSGYIPLPLGTDEDFPEVKGKVFRNLTGFASYGGFQSLGEAYRSGNVVLSSRYNIEDLKVASEFVDIMEHISTHLQSILPNCQCFEDVANGKKTGGEVISEQFFNMVGIRVWANMRKAELFIMDSAKYTAFATITGAADKYHNIEFDKFLKNIDDQPVAELNARGEFFEELVHAGLGRFYSGETSSGESLLQTLGRSVRQRVRALGDQSTFNKTLTLVQKSNAFFNPAANYGITEGKDIVDLVRQWITPTVARGFGVEDTADPAHDNAKLQPNVRTVTIHDANDSGKVADEKGGFLGIDKCVEASNMVDWLALSSPLTNETFLPLFGPLRLQTYGLIIQAMILTCETLSDAKFLEAFLKLNSLMMPYSPTLKVANKNCLNIGMVGKDNGGQFPIQRDKLFVGENIVVAEREKLYPRNGTKFTGVMEVVRIFEEMLADIFGDDFQEEINNMLAILKEAKEEEAKFEKEVAAVVSGTVVELKLPFLKALGKSGKQSAIKLNKQADTFPAIVESLLLTKGTNHVATTLGLKLTDAAEDLGGATQSMIGGRVGQRKRQPRGFSMEVKGDEEEGLSFASSESFVLTSLTLSADQLEKLFAKNGPEMSKQQFDIRVGQPYDPSRYVPIDGQTPYLELVRRKNKDHLRAMQGTAGRFGNANLSPSEWVDVPLRYIEHRSKITFFGPKFERTNHAKALPNIAGVRMSAFSTESFKRNCRDLDEGCLNELEKAMAICWMCTPFTRQACQALQRKNIRIPMNFLVVRPHANYLMEMCAVLAPGLADLGFTAIAGKDYTYGFTTLTKEMYANLSYWAGIITLHPENCRLIRNLMCVGYGPGGGVGWYNPRDYNPLKLGSYKTPQAGSESLMCMAIPFNENITRPYIVTSGRLQHVDDGHGSSTSVAKAQGDDTPHFNTYMRYNLIWKWRDVKDSHLMETMGDNGQYPLYNKVCWSGFTMYYDPKTKGLKYATRNKGHWGENEGPGCQRIRQGAVEVFPDFEYSKRFHIVS